jgi:hypothetical protein
MYHQQDVLFQHVREEPAVRIRPTTTNTPAHSGGAATRRVGPTRQRDIGPGGRGPRRGRNCARAPLTLLFVHAIKLGLFRKQNYLISDCGGRSKNPKPEDHHLIRFGSSISARGYSSLRSRSVSPSVIPQFSLEEIGHCSIAL